MNLGRVGEEAHIQTLVSNRHWGKGEQPASQIQVKDYSRELTSMHFRELSGLWSDESPCSLLPWLCNTDPSSIRTGTSPNVSPPQGETEVQILLFGTIFSIDYSYPSSFSISALTVGWHYRSLENTPQWDPECPRFNTARRSALWSHRINPSWMSDCKNKTKQNKNEQTKNCSHPHAGGFWDFCLQGKEQFHLTMSLKKVVEEEVNLFLGSAFNLKIRNVSLDSSLLLRKLHFLPLVFQTERTNTESLRGFQSYLRTHWNILIPNLFK